MDTSSFRRYLKKLGKKDHIIDGLVCQIECFEQYLSQERGKRLDSATSEDIQDYVTLLEAGKFGAAKEELRGIALYYKCIGDTFLASCASELREQRIAKVRSSFPLRDFLGIDPQAVLQLTALGVIHADQMLAAGATPEKRAALAQASSVSEAQILELVKLSDLSRLAGVKAIRARLYYDAGVDTVEKMASYEPEELLALTADFVRRTGFTGIPPLPKEVQSGIATARKMPKVVVY